MTRSGETSVSDVENSQKPTIHQYSIYKVDFSATTNLNWYCMASMQAGIPPQAIASLIKLATYKTPICPWYPQQMLSHPSNAPYPVSGEVLDAIVSLQVYESIEIKKLPPVCPPGPSAPPSLYAADSSNVLRNY